ncbi:class I SAM-dependent methyltransferase [Streptomyces sp. P38-E01]|uniref:Class I SAM-dependent methyltransferase n=1 Tax=Streptomyces tardus TaxID=2780544 RepID=A0A949JCP6_9ACTN|nr:class I SAM-dependent methyltransferase [Streptomyces tardus]MBU7597027.1 class I SAM-dependent methyltransferase [Streptomyces tardus]
MAAEHTPGQEQAHHPHGDGDAHEHGQTHGRDHAHAHTHSHGSGEEPDWEAMADTLVQEAQLQADGVRRSARWLGELLGERAARVGRVLDVGSGPGVNTAVLAEEFANAEVVAVDGTPALLEHAQRQARAAGVDDRVRTLHAELPDDFLALGRADLIWTSHAVHHIGDQQAALASLGGALLPGGLLAVAERGLPLRYLPRDIGIGRPGLLTRLEAVREEWFSRMRAELPGSTSVVEHWPALLSGAGLLPSGSRTFLVEAPTPLAEPARQHLYALLSRARETLAEDLDTEDLTTLDRLLDRDAAEGVLHRPDAFYLTATTVHTATRPA